MDILSKTDITVEQARQWAKNKKATDLFISLADTYWNKGNETGVNPSIAYCQFAKESGYGHFGGVLDESYCNPCGLKTTQGGGNYDPNAHMRFPSWEIGQLAQKQHLALYGNQVGYPLQNPVDPRHFPYLLGKCKTVESLGGCYAPSLDYGTSIVNLVNEMKNVVFPKDDNIPIDNDTPIDNNVSINLIEKISNFILKVFQIIKIIINK